MPFVNRDITLTNGPPWGFRLYEDPYEGLIVSKVRQRSVSELAGLREGDKLVAINGVATASISHAQAVQIIDFASYVLTLTVGRMEKQRKMETIYLDNAALRSKQTVQEVTTTELQLMWEKQRTPTPPPRVEPPPVDQPMETDVNHPISISQLMREYEVPKLDHIVKRKPYADSAFYNDPNKCYPTVEEQMNMCKRVAESLEAPDNRYSTGAQMYEKQKARADRYVKEGPDPEPDPYEESMYLLLDPEMSMTLSQADDFEFNVTPKPFTHQATAEQLARMPVPIPPPPPPPPAPRTLSGLPRSTVGYPASVHHKIPSAPPVPPPPPGQPKTVQEYLEKIRKFPKSKHDTMDPQQCFDIAAALHGSGSRGAKLFAKRKARAAKFEMESQGHADDNDGGQPSGFAKPRLASKLPTAVMASTASMGRMQQPALSQQPQQLPVATALVAGHDQEPSSVMRMNVASPVSLISLAEQSTAHSAHLSTAEDKSDAVPEPVLPSLTLFTPSQCDSMRSTPTASLVNESITSGSTATGSTWKPVKFHLPAVQSTIS